MSEHGILNLDELFGIDRPIVVNWKEKRYELRRPDGLTPPEYVRWQKVQGQIAGLQAAKGDLTDKEADLLEEVVDKAITLLNVDLIKAGLSFPAKVRVLQFYTDEIAKEKFEATKDPKN